MAFASALLQGNLGLFYGFIVAFIASYIVLAGGSFVFLYIIKPRSLSRLKVKTEMPSRQEIFHEIRWSAIALCVWAFMAVILIYLVGHGATKMYFDISAYGIGYFIFSILFLIVSHDAYFYWTHRLMHSSTLMYNHVHTLHHKSTNPTPFAIFSFSPLEAVILGAYVYLVVLVMPIHIYALFVLFVFDTVINMMGHLGYEVVPQSVSGSRFGRIFNTTVHHALHHSGGRSNYGSYFSFWDLSMKTSNPDNEKVWAELHKRAQESRT